VSFAEECCLSLGKQACRAAVRVRRGSVVHFSRLVSRIGGSMKAAVLKSLGPVSNASLQLVDVMTPTPARGQVLIKVLACGVCRSNLHMIEGDWAPNTPARLPIIPGHEVVGEIVELGPEVAWLSVGDRVGVQPIFSTCGRCDYCVTGREQLCGAKQVTGETVDGGYAEYMLAEAAYAYVLPAGLSDLEAAPLFCPGITAFASASKARLEPGMSVAVFGVGGVGHLVIQMAGLWGTRVSAVSGSQIHQELAEELGAAVIDAHRDPVGVLLRRGGVDASIVFAPSSIAVAQAVAVTRRGGTIVVGVHAEVGALPFDQEKTVVGSLLGTRRQMREVLELADAGKIRTECEAFPLEGAVEALVRLKRGKVRGRAVIAPAGC